MAAPAEPLTAESLRLDDPGRTADEIAERLREVVYKDLRRRGAVVGLSGGVDSSLVAHLCARAFGPERVLGVLMPEGESASDTLDLSNVAEAAGVETVLEDITELLRAAGCYERRDAAIRTVFRSTAGAGRRRSSSQPSSAAPATASSPSSPSRPTASAVRRG